MTLAQRTLTFATSLVAIAMLALTAEAGPAQTCANYDPATATTLEDYTDYLRERYGEEKIWAGFMPQYGVMAQLQANPETGTWTIFQIFADQTVCHVIDGSESYVYPAGIAY